MNKINPLLIDDDQDICELLQQYFATVDIKLITALKPSLGLALLEANAFDVLILDVMLPEMDGFEFCRTLRTHTNENIKNIPIIMLTARGNVMDRIVGLELGADDYLPKPFEPRELLARCQNLSKRFQAKAEFKQKVILKEATNAVEIEGKAIILTGMEFQALKLLMQTNSALSRDEIQNKLKGIDSQLYSRAIDILMSRLRTKLATITTNNIIKTHRSKGYQFVGHFT